MNTPVNRYRYTTTNIYGTAIQKPLGESSFRIEWSREEEERLSYTKKAQGKLTFTGQAFTEFYDLDKSGFRCEYVDMLIEENCSGGFVPLFSGRISLNDGEWNVDRCEVSFKIEDIQPDQCFIDNKTQEANIFEISSRHVVNTYPGNITIEKREFTSSGMGSFGPCVSPVWGDTGTGASNHYESFYHTYAYNEVYQVCISTTRWARYKIVVPCGGDSPGPGWALIDTDCPGDGLTYVKPVNLFACTDTPVNNGGGLVTGQTHECQIVNETTGGAIDNGLSLKDVLELFVNRVCPGFTVVSDFFQINPENESTTNYVTGLTTKVNQLFIFQKSDVKRAGALNNATLAIWTPEKCLNAICRMFNCRWRVESNVFRIEHISFFSKIGGLNLTDPKYKKYVVGMHKYTYTTEKIPAKEEFKFMEASEGDFAGVPIVYTGACVTQEGRQNVQTYAAEDVTTDVELCFANADGDSNLVDDKGFVIIATSGPANLIITEDPILSSVQKLNNSLAWAQLHRDYHRHYRPLQFGIMNNVETEFLSLKPTKKGATITIPLCCDDVFDPDDTVLTMMGQGVVDKAVFSLRDKTIQLDLLYQVGDLVINQPPVANNDVVETFKNTSLDIDVLSNDTDNEGDDIQEVLIIGNPMHGAVTINPDKTINYIPYTNYVGPDLFTYQIRDAFNWSVPALVTITVYPPAISMELVNDQYTTPKNTGLSVAAGAGLLINDSTVGGTLVCTAEIKTTALGGTIQIFADGAFTYTPPTTFVGSDSFEYTATNGTHTDTATAAILVTLPCRTYVLEPVSGSPTVQYRDCGGVVRNTSILSSPTSICTNGHGFTPSGGVVNLLDQFDGDC